MSSPPIENFWRRFWKGVGTGKQLPPTKC